MKGTIKLISEKGFGFIKSNHDYYFKAKNLFWGLKEGDSVIFTTEDYKGKIQATNIYPCNPRLYISKSLIYCEGRLLPTELHDFFMQEMIGYKEVFNQKVIQDNFLQEVNFSNFAKPLSFVDEDITWGFETISTPYSNEDLEKISTAVSAFGLSDETYTSHSERKFWVIIDGQKKYGKMVFEPYFINGSLSFDGLIYTLEEFRDFIKNAALWQLNNYFYLTSN